MTFRPLFVSTSPTTLLQQADVIIELESHFQRQRHPSLDGTYIEAPWARMVEANPRMFNGTKFRLHAVEETEQREDEKEMVPSPIRGKLTLQLGITDYRCCAGTDFVCGENSLLLRSGKTEDGSSSLPSWESVFPDRKDRDPHMAHALGVEALVVTADNKAVLFKRSQHVTENAGWYCCPGGHAEPFAVLKKISSSNSNGGDGLSPIQPFLEALKAIDPSAVDSFGGRLSGTLSLDEAAAVHDLILKTLAQSHDTETAAAASLEAAVVHELFDSPMEEVVAEIGVPKETLTNAGLRGVAVNDGLGGKPDLIFLVRCSLTSDEIAKIHARGDCEESYESEGPLVFLSLDEDVPRERNEKKMLITPPSRACLELLTQ